MHTTPRALEVASDVGFKIRIDKHVAITSENIAQMTLFNIKMIISNVPIYSAHFDELSSYQVKKNTSRTVEC